MKLRVLMLEDSLTDAELIGLQLKKEGWDIDLIRVDTRADFLTALNGPLDLILADYSLPGFTGLDAIKLLKETNLDIPIILVSGTIGEEVAVKAMKEGAHDYLLKGNLTRLAPAIRNALEEKRLRDEKHTAEQILAASEARFRALIEKSADGIALLTAEGIVLYGSPAASSIFGLSSDEFIGRNVLDFVHPEEKEPANALFETLLQMPGASVHGTYRLHHSNDSWLWVEGIGTNLLSDPSVQAIVVNYRDVTERQQADGALRETQARLAGILDIAAEAIISIDEGQNITLFNQGAEKIFGYQLEEILGRPLDLLIPPRFNADHLKHITNFHVAPQITRRMGERLDIFGLRKDGSEFTAEASVSKLLIGDKTTFTVILRDITDRRRAEEALQESEQRFRMLFSASPDAILLLDMDAQELLLPIVDCNEAACLINGYDHEELVGRSIGFLDANSITLEQSISIIEQIRQRGVLHFETTHRHKDGHIFPIEVSITSLAIGGREMALSIERDITQRKEAELALREAETRYRLLVERIPAVTYIVASESPFNKTLFISPQVEQILGFTPEEWISTPDIWKRQIHPDDFERVMAEDKASHEGHRHFASEYRIFTRDGRVVWLHDEMFHIDDVPGIAPFSQGIEFDITERKQAEQALRDSEKRFRSLFENTPVAIWEEDFSLAKEYLDNFKDVDIDSLEEYLIQHPEVVSTCLGLVKVMDINQATLKMHEAHEKSELTNSISPTFTPETIASFRQELMLIARREYQMEMDVELQTLTGKRKQATLNWVVAPGHEETYSRVLISLVDLTERLRRERELEAIASINAALRTSKSLDDLLLRLLDQTLSLIEVESGSIWLYDPASNIISLKIQQGWNIENLITSFRSDEEIPGMVAKSGEAVISRDFSNDLRILEENRKNIPKGVGGACIPLRTSEYVVGVLFVSIRLPREITTADLRVLNTLAEIGGNAIHRTQLYEQTKQHLERLESLRTIDLTISASLDLRTSLNIVLEQVVKQLHVDAASVLLMDNEKGRLAFAAGRGFRTQAIETTSLSLGEGYAGQAALERQIVHVKDLTNSTEKFVRHNLLAGEQFISYFGVPLIAKGEIKGVLEIFHRSVVNADMEWLNFLDSLSWQTAIAIDNALLFAGVQRSNLDLTLAYEATIEGWSRALDLRDKETEGHTQRVTSLSLELARQMGIKEQQLLHMRRGALLHDIGKMGVPDNILLKPGQLTDAEWHIMRQHPQLARDMLEPIAYLQDALDIPFCHHEKWDGTGYPRGLKGEGIPFAARIFAVVDVWDALTSDRPYRPAWSKKETLTHIREQSGKHFDPKVVEGFLLMMSGEIS